MKDVALNQIRAEYDRKRLKALNDAELRKNRIYETFPRIEEIDKEIALLGIKLSKFMILKPENLNYEISEIKKQIDNLKIEKNGMFEEKKIPKDYFDIKYECSICKDTGFLENGEKCKCYKQRLIESLYNMSNIKYMLNKENFDAFNINLFSNEKYRNEDITPKQNMHKILSTCEVFCNDFNKINASMLFYGGTGLGKTFMCNCIANELIQNGKTVIYQTAPNIIEIVENHRFNKNEETVLNRENYNYLFNCDLLIIDDLGTEFNNSFTNSELFNIINTRMTSGKKMVISTNLELDKLAITYSDRIISRIFNEFTICYFFGKDLRWESC